MKNDEIHIKNDDGNTTAEYLELLEKALVQAEARYYLDIKQKEKEEKRQQFIFKVLVTTVVLLFSIIIIAPIAG